MRGGGTSQCGQSIGPGLQIDTSKYYNRVLEVNAEQQWVRVEPGIVLDELNAQLAPLGLRFAPDISTASRATIGGMMANNAAGARSVWWGRTIDHVLEMVVALSDLKRRSLRRNSTERSAGRGHAGGRLLSHGAWPGQASTPPRLTAAIRRSCAMWVATTWTSLPTIRSRSISPRLWSVRKGPWGIVLEAKLRLVRLPKAKGLMVSCSATCWNR